MSTMTLATLFLAVTMSPADANLIVGGGFEEGLTGWGDLWTRTPGGRLELDPHEPHRGRQSAHIQHTGREDWSFNQSRRLAVQAGQIYELSGWVRGAGEGDHSTLPSWRGR